MRRFQMRRKSITLLGSIALVLVLVSVLVVGAGAQARFWPPPRAIDPIVSTDWLETNLGAEDLVILDVRTPDEYTGGHITGAINSPETNWYLFFAPNGLIMELPAVEDLFTTIGAAGITGDSLVVVVGRTSDSTVGPAFYALAGATRVADTLIYAGVKNVAILDGGYDKWVADGKTGSATPVTPGTYTGVVNEAMFVSKDYVARKMRGATIIDGRDAEFYFGIGMEPFYTREGHIPGATCLPAPWLWTPEGTYYIYKDTDVLREMASGAVGRYFSPREIIAYCGVGGYASTTYFVLSEVLGYKNVKIYDGSAQEWTADPGAPLVVYKWE